MDDAERGFVLRGFHTQTAFLPLHQSVCCPASECPSLRTGVQEGWTEEGMQRTFPSALPFREAHIREDCAPILAQKAH